MDDEAGGPCKAVGPGKVLHGDPRDLVGEAHARLGDQRPVQLDVRDFDAVGGESRRLRLTDARGIEAGDLQLDRRLRGRFEGDALDRDRTVQEVERDRAVARLAPRRPNLLERGLDLAGGPVLHIILEAKESGSRDHECGDHGDQGFLIRPAPVADCAGVKVPYGRSNEGAGRGLLTVPSSDVASKRLPVLHIRLILPENRPLLDLPKK